jgi:hypothetical protein
MANEDNQYTESGTLGRRARSALASAYRKAKVGAKEGYDYINDAVTEYVQEPLLNVYPQSVNLLASAGEFGAGLFNKPVNLGRYPYYDLPTRFDEKPPVIQQREEYKIDSKPTSEDYIYQVESNKTLEEYKSQTEPVKKEKAKPIRAWRVMLQGGNPSQDVFADTKEEAESILKKMGGKGAVAGIKFPSPEARDQYMQSSAEGGRTAQTPIQNQNEEEMLRNRLSESGATKKQQDKYLKNLERLRSERETRKSASREQAAKDRQRFEDFASGATRSQFASDIAAKRASEEQLNQYNKQLSSLRKAYREAGKAGDYVEQYRLGDFINSYTAGVPKEMGAREKAAKRGIIENRNRELSEKIRRDREARIAAERTSRANPDYQQFNPVY